MPAVPLLRSCPLLWSPRSPGGDGSGSRPLSTPLESSLRSGQPKEVEAVLIVPLVSGGSCRDPQALVDVRYNEMDFKEYLNFQTCISFFQKACKPFAQSHCLFVPVDKFYRAGTIFAFIPCFAKWVVMGVWVVMDVSNS